jgi:putative transposase
VSERRVQVQSLLGQGVSLGAALKAVGLAKSTWCYRPHPRPPRALRPLVVTLLREVTGYELTYGYRKLTAWLGRKGLWINRKSVLRHTRALAMLQPKKRKGPRFTALARVTPTEANTHWEGDFTPVDDREGRSWVCAIVDPAQGSRPMAGEFSERCRAKEACAVLEAAILEAFPAEGRVPEAHRLVLRVDRGGQFIAKDFRTTAWQLGVTLEYCGVRCPNDKPNVEAFFSLYKTEEVYRNEYRTQAEARAGWIRWRGWYINERLHSRLGYRPPVECEPKLAQVNA